MVRVLTDCANSSMWQRKPCVLQKKKQNQYMIADYDSPAYHFLAVFIL